MTINMKKSKTKLAIQTLTTRDDVEAAASRYADAANQLRVVTAWRDQLILHANERDAADIARYQAEMEAEADALRAWALANPDEFARRKSLDLTSAVIGFRTDPPKVSLLSRAWTWEKVTALLAAQAPEFVRTKQEVNKEAILDAYASNHTDLSAYGIKVTQSEQFFVEAKLSDAPAEPNTKSQVH